MGDGQMGVRLTVEVGGEVSLGLRGDGAAEGEGGESCEEEGRLHGGCGCDGGNLDW